MPHTPEEFWQVYQAWQEDVDKFFLKNHKSAGIPDSHVAAAILQHNTNNADLLNTLPWGTRQELIQRFRTQVLQADDDVLAAGWKEIGPGGGGVRIGRRITPSTGALSAPQEFILRQLSIQKLDEVPVEGNQFKFGANLPRRDYIKNIMDQMSSGVTFRRGDSVLVFDTETLGLASDEASVRQVSAIKMNMAGDTLAIDSNKLFDEHFNVSRSAYGSIYDQQSKRLVRMDNYIRHRIARGAAIGAPGDGADFVARTVPILAEMQKATYIAGHNVSFDISQILGNVVKTKAYHDAQTVGGYNVRNLVDEIGAKIENGGVIDTLTMAREYFDDTLDLAPEFKRTLQPRAFSLENLMMQTNLVDLMKRDLGQEFFDVLRGGVQHEADIDTKITGQLLSYLTSGKRELRPRVLGGTGDVDELAIRRATLRSYAPTPVSNIADISHMDPKMFAKLYDEAISGKDTLSISKLSTGELVNLNPGEAGLWYNRLLDESSDYVPSARLTLMEQHVDAVRNLSLRAEDTDSVAGRLGAWKRFSGSDTPYEGMLNRMQTLFKAGHVPGDSEFSAFQHRMAKAGMPFAGISLEERILTGALAESGARRGAVRKFLAGTPEERVAQYGDDLGIGRFMMESKYNPFKSGGMGLPLEILQSAGIGTFGDEAAPQMLSISTIQSSKNVNLMYDTTEEEAQRLMSFLREGVADGGDSSVRRMLGERGLTQNVIGEFEERFITNEGWKRGIAIGKLEGDAGSAAYHGISDLLQDLTRDRDKIPFRVGFMNFERGADGKGIIRTGAAILDRFMTDTDKARYAEDLGLAQHRMGQLAGELTTKHGTATARAAYDYGIADLGVKANALYDAAKKRLPMVGGVAAIAFGGYYARKKYKEKQLYETPMHQQDYENQDDYADYRQEMGMSSAPAVRRPDPLLYAGVTGNLHNSAIGHTQMGSRSAGLFAGV